ncbi:unnamed protein product [Owenia fusiformis]|uniref:Uncharacterized protein n=1 Tax=Owenia fusiformis TaxID=6347 RepID=A0A8S4QBV3_OWEFU|nr:unnamed protein product [Owenia fusiformis]
MHLKYRKFSKEPLLALKLFRHILERIARTDILQQERFMSMKKGYTHHLGFAVAVFISLLSSIVLVVILFLIPTEPNALVITTGCLILFTTILTNLLIYVPKVIIIERGGDPLSMELFPSLGAAFVFLKIFAGENQLPNVGSGRSLGLPKIDFAAGKIELNDNNYLTNNAEYHHGKKF